MIGPLVAESLAAGDADSWFFLRYGDPRWHLRVRLHGSAALLTSSVIPRLHRLAAPYLADGRVWRIALGTYEREIERYGGDAGMPLCEAIFRTDSDAALAIQRVFSGDAAADARWRLTLRGLHLLRAFTVEERASLVGGLRHSFAAEHRVGGPFEKQLGAKFRRERSELEWLLQTTPAEAEGGPLYPGFLALEARSARQEPLARQLRSLSEQGRLTTSLAALTGSPLHMHANRVLRSEQRAQELVLYDFLARFYASELARKRGQR